MPFALVPRESTHARRSGEAIVTEEPETGTSSYDRESAVRAILEQEDSVLGRVYRYDVEGLTPAEIAQAEENQEVLRLQLPAPDPGLGVRRSAQEPLGGPQRRSEASQVA